MNNAMTVSALRSDGQPSQDVSAAPPSPRPCQRAAEASSPGQRTVVLYAGQYCIEPWVHQQALGHERYRCHVAATQYVNRDAFPNERVHLIEDENRLVGWWHRLLCGAETFRRPTAHRTRMWRFMKILKETDADLIHAHFLWNDLAARVAEEWRGPLVVTAHGTDVNAARTNEHYREKVQQVFAVARRIIAVSDFVAAKLAEVGCPREKIVRIPLGVSLPPVCADVARAEGRTNIVCIASLRAVKGHKYLLEAFAEAARHEPRLFLTLVGEGKLRGEIEAQSRGLGIEKRVRLTGWVPPRKVREILKTSHIYAQHSIGVTVEEKGGPSLHEEGLGLSLVEAASFGLPLVATRSGGIPEICRDGENGLLVDERDTAGMAEKLVQLARDPQLRSTLGARGRAIVEREFDLRKQLGALEDLYDDVLAEAAQ